MLTDNIEATQEAGDTASETQPNQTIPPGTAPKAKEKPARSSIQFSYVGEDEAASVAQAIFDYGVPLSREQLSGIMVKPDANGVSKPDSLLGLKLAGARLFGLIEPTPEGGKYGLTALGHEIVSTDESVARAAKAKAFLLVPLHKRTYDEFRGKLLPVKPAALERVFIDFGCAPKQADKARQAFNKSAQFAGFFAAGRDRLVEPIIRPTMSRAAEILEKVNFGDTADVSARRAPTDHQAARHQQTDATKEYLIAGLLQRLPAPGTPWSHDKRAQWLQVLASNWELVYEAPDDEAGYSVKITVDRAQGR